MIGRLFLSVALFLSALPAFAANARLLILHTNDLHDHMRPGAYGQGGLPYVAGYVRQVRQERKDILLVDAGDVTEKGDMVAAMTGHRMTYEAMRRIGYDAVTIGNHDDDAGLPGLRGYEKALGQSLLCLNLAGKGATQDFEGSRLIRKGELRIGVIGLITPRKTGLNPEESGEALAREAGRLKKEAHLVIAVCHEGPVRCATWSRMAPAVDVFISGHTHELVPAPITVPETGARIVQAGYYARWVGKLELVVDLEAKRVVEAKGENVPMMHDSVPVDADMLQWVRVRERELCPEASIVVVKNSELVGLDAVAWLAADALRRQAAANIGFCHVGQIIRSPIFAGPVDVNALYLAGGDRGNEAVELELTGAEIGAYLTELVTGNDDPTNWSGFKARRIGALGSPSHYETDLQAAGRYRVVMPQLEFETRFLRAVKKQKEQGKNGPLVAREFVAHPSKASFTGAMRIRAEQLESAGRSLTAEAQALEAAGSEGPRNRKQSKF